MVPNSTNSIRPSSTWLRRIRRLVAYWSNLIAQPVLAIAFVVGLAWLFGYMQRNHNWFNDATTSIAEETGEERAQYACSMLCVFVNAPGRCPVCGMELQKIETDGDPKDIYGVTIDPSARRLANIETVAALNMPVSKMTEALGRVTYDETTESTVSAWVDGRIEELIVNFTGATIRKGDELAIIYSPKLYADQVALLEAKKALATESTSPRLNRTNQLLYENSRQRLIEQGLPETQVDSIESSGKAKSRIRITAPTSGTVVEKLVDEGKYVETGMPILKIADLSTVWLMLEMFPEDTANLKLGQTVSVEIRSHIGKAFEGKISFIDPIVDRQTQTVNVRVAIPNDAGLIKVGDFGKAFIQTNIGSVEQLVVVPRESVLMNGSNSIAYVETEPGRFEFRQVTIAEIIGDRVSIADGIRAGEQVVSSGAFMLDSTFNIQGKVSLIDPNRAALKNQSQLAIDDSEANEIEESFASLTREDRGLAEAQVICPVTEVKLGTMGMGTPINVDVNGRPVMICCEGCRKSLLEEPEKYLAILAEYKSSQVLSGDFPIGRDESSATDELPQVDLPQMELPEMELPQMEVPK